MWDAWAPPQEVAYRSGAASRFSLPAMLNGAFQGAQHAASHLQGAFLGAQAALGQNLRLPPQLKEGWANLQKHVPGSQQGSSK
jgi:hypothetical protein